MNEVWFTAESRDACAHGDRVLTGDTVRRNEAGGLLHQDCDMVQHCVRPAAR